LRRIIGAFPATLRYDRLSLKREQVNPDYEHLWLRCENLALAERSWPEFEFRLSCAAVRPESFGNHPKLEFPEQDGQAPFTGWFVESQDDFGPKLELRFATPEAMDMAVWRRLPAEDQALVLGLLQRLPSLLKALQVAGIRPQRPWEEWLAMVKEMQRIIAIHNLSPPQSSVAAVLALFQEHADKPRKNNPSIKSALSKRFAQAIGKGGRP